MTDKHPITPPPELVKQWWKDAQQANYSDGLPCWLNYIATQAARWGADQELEACCEHLKRIWSPSGTIDSLRAARRPKPPTLKEQALAELELLRGDANSMGMGFDAPAIRRALEALPND
jgi:hypothetical protein